MGFDTKHRTYIKYFVKPLLINTCEALMVVTFHLWMDDHKRYLS